MGRFYFLKFYFPPGLKRTLHCFCKHITHITMAVWDPGTHTWVCLLRMVTLVYFYILSLSMTRQHLQQWAVFMQTVLGESCLINNAQTLLLSTTQHILLFFQAFLEICLRELEQGRLTWVCSLPPPPGEHVVLNQSCYEKEGKTPQKYQNNTIVLSTSFF